MDRIKKEEFFHVQEMALEYVCWPYQISWPIMWILARWVTGKRAILKFFNMGEPDTNTFWFDGLGKACRKIKEGAATWRALEVIYNYKKSNERFGFIDNFWVNMRNAQAVRNRFTLIQRELRGALLECARAKRSGEPVRILSLASGSAQGVLDTVAKLTAEGYDISVLLIDIDKEVESHVRRITQTLGLSEKVVFRSGNVLRFEQHLRSFRPDVVEMLGFLDYLENKTARWLMGRVKKILPSGGFFFTCHIHDNPERDFLFNVVNWGRDPFMLYRSPEEFDVLVWESGFTHRKLITEPHQIHSLICARVI